MEERVYTKKKPSRKTMEDIAYGYTVSAHLKELGAGRTVVVKRKTIMAAEGIEGMEEVIKRGCLLSNKDAVVVIAGGGGAVITKKLLETLKEYKAKVLAVLIDAAVIEDMGDFTRFADELGLIFLAFSGEKFYNIKLFEI